MRRQAWRGVLVMGSGSIEVWHGFHGWAIFAR